MSKPEEKHPAEYWIELFRPKSSLAGQQLIEQMARDKERREREHKDYMAEHAKRMAAFEAQQAELEAQQKEAADKRRKAQIDREVDLELALEEQAADSDALAGVIEDHETVLAEQDAEIAEIQDALMRLVEAVQALTA